MDLIKEINDKYIALEAEIDKKLEKVEADEMTLERQSKVLSEKSGHTQSIKVLSYEEALLRNSNTLKSLEIAKARLRSRSTYSPVEKLLQQAIKNYKVELESNQKDMDASKEDLNDAADNLYDFVTQNLAGTGATINNNNSSTTTHQRRRQH